MRPLLLLKTMKKEILIVLSVVLVVVIVACGLWLGYYAVDSQHQKQTYQTLAEDITFAVEETSELQFVGMVDEPSPEEPEDPDEPQTPDEPTEPEEPTPTVPQTSGSRAALWVGALLILALGGLGITLILLKKQNKL